MSLPVLVVIVVVGIAAVVLAVHWSGGTRDAALADEIEARARFGADFPGEPVTGVVLARDGKTAFLDIDAVRTGIVRGFGSKFLTRIVTPADIAALERSGERRITLTLRDFAWRGGAFDFADTAAADHVAARLSPANQNSKRMSA